MEWRGAGLTGKEFPIINTSSIIFDKNGSWEMSTESMKNVYNKHSDEIMHMIKSFSMNPTAAAVTQQTQQQTQQQNNNNKHNNKHNNQEVAVVS